MTLRSLAGSATIPGSATLAAVSVLAAAACWLRPGAACDARLAVPDGFCVSVFADDVGPARHLAVAANGDVYVATWREGEREGGILALRDTNGDGRADRRGRFAPEAGSGIAIRGDRLYFATWTDVYRYRLSPPSLVPTAPAETVVTGMPRLEHGARSIAVGDSGLFVNIGAPSNACERDYPRRDFTGAYPCRELETSGGIWRFEADGQGQRPAAANRYATGLRHTVALGVSPVDGRLYGAPHGIDHLDRWWPASGYTPQDAANVPSETLFRVDSGGDYGFPYCMHDPRSGRMIVAPAYAGMALADRCATSPLPLATFAAHSAPMAIVWYQGTAFPPEYRDGMFVALHGSLFHAPEEPRGHAVMVVDPRTRLPREFARARSRLGAAAARPSGLAVTPDGTLLVADDYGQRIWAIRYTGKAPESRPASEVQRVLRKYAAALGGEERVRRIVARTVLGTFEYRGVAQHATGRLDMMWRAPSSLVERLHGPMGTITRGFDGTTAWGTHPQVGVRRLSSFEIDEIVLSGVLYQPLGVRHWYGELSYEGRKDVDGRQTEVLAGARRGGKVDRFYFDVVSGLPVLLDLWEEGPEAVRSGNPDEFYLAHYRLDDYRTVDGMAVPFLVRRQRPNATMTFRFIEVRHNANLPDSLFRAPARSPGG